ncbi:hypothetical protein [Nostoc sp. FACHB-190]|nr:hypothetical protein [Nostoc sp. FACHB-190]MBD2303400.1 hypothetical protein [Nostoc sp. FACHB-190]
MYQPHELFNNLSPEEINRTLHLSEIGEKESYTEDDADRFRECRSLMEQGKTDEEIKNLLPSIVVLETVQNNSVFENNNGKKGQKKPTKSLDITGLLNFARKQGFKLKLSEALKILEFCELEEQDEYTPQEVERFIDACQSIGEQTSISNVLVDIEDITTETESDLTGMVDKVTDKFVEKIPRGLVRQVYTKKAIARLAEQPEESEDFLKQMEKQILARIEGKPSPMQQLWEKHQIKFLPPTRMNSMQLPSASDNDTTTS